MSVLVVTSRRPLAVRIINPVHPAGMDHIVTQLHAGELVCSCPAFNGSCHHTHAVAAKLAGVVQLATAPRPGLRWLLLCQAGIILPAGWLYCVLFVLAFGKPASR